MHIFVSGVNTVLPSSVSGVMPLVPLARPILLITAVLATSACGRGLPGYDTPVRPASGPIVVVANQDHGVATIVDLTEWRVVTHVDVDMNPHEAALSPDGRTVALASPSTWLGDARKIALMDARSASLVRSIDLDTFRWPHGVAFLDARTLVVSSRARSGIVFLDTLSGAALGSAEAPRSEPYLLHVARSTGRIYTSSPATNTIAEYDLASRSFVRDIAVADSPAGFAVSPDGRTLWASTGTHGEGGTVVAIDAASGSVRARLPVRGHIRRFTFTGDGTRVLATDVIDNTVLVFDAQKLHETGRMPLGEEIAPSGVTCDPVESRCYVSASHSGELIEIEVAALKVVRRLYVGPGADGVVLIPAGQR